MKPQISIIVPVYNVELYLRRCVNSIFEQSFTNFELILVNDGSSDGCRDICDFYSNVDARVQVIHKPHGGVSSARNRGLEAAIGEYIAFVDSDDYIHPEMLKILYDHALLYSSDMVMCNYMKTRGDCVENEAITQIAESSHYTKIQALDRLLSVEEDHETGKSNGLHWALVCNKLYKRDLFEDVRFEEGKIFEDLLIIHKLLYNCNKITFVPQKLYYYFQRDNSIINSAFTVKKLDKVYALEDRASFFRFKNERDLYYRALKCYLDVFYWYYYKAKRELRGDEEKINELKKRLYKWVKPLLMNPRVNLKQKLLLILFLVKNN